MKIKIDDPTIKYFIHNGVVYEIENGEVEIPEEKEKEKEKEKKKKEE